MRTDTIIDIASVTKALATTTGLLICRNEKLIDFDAIATPRISDNAVKRSFGWIVEDELKPPGFSKRTIYHSGWSGQTVFLDLEKRFYAIVLTTRTLNEYERARRGRFKIIEELGKVFNCISENSEYESKL